MDCLLNEDRKKAQDLAINAAGSVGVQGLTWLPCPTPDELLKTFQRGQQALIYAETNMNKHSSRSHAVFQIKIVKRERSTAPASAGPQQFKATFSKLSIVDLAGSERIKRSGAEGERFKARRALSLHARSSPALLRFAMICSDNFLLLPAILIPCA